MRNYFICCTIITNSSLKTPAALLGLQIAGQVEVVLVCCICSLITTQETNAADLISSRIFSCIYSLEAMSSICMMGLPF